MEKELPKNGSAGGMNRRQALRVGSVIGTGLFGALSRSAGESDGPINGIAEIRMKSTRLDEHRRFYEEKLGLHVTLKDDQLTVAAGSTRLISSPTESTGDQPFHHYAFNIPENKIEAARQWQKKRTPLLRRGKKRNHSLLRNQCSFGLFQRPGWQHRRIHRSTRLEQFGPRRVRPAGHALCQ